MSEDVIYDRRKWKAERRHENLYEGKPDYVRFEFGILKVNFRQIWIIGTT